MQKFLLLFISLLSYTSWAGELCLKSTKYEIHSNHFYDTQIIIIEDGMEVLTIEDHQKKKGTITEEHSICQNFNLTRISELKTTAETAFASGLYQSTSYLMSNLYGRFTGDAVPAEMRSGSLLFRLIKKSKLQNKTTLYNTHFSTSIVPGWDLVKPHITATSDYSN